MLLQKGRYCARYDQAKFLNKKVSKSKKKQKQPDLHIKDKYIFARKH